MKCGRNSKYTGRKEWPSAGLRDVTRRISGRKNLYARDCNKERKERLRESQASTRENEVIMYGMRTGLEVKLRTRALLTSSRPWLAYSYVITSVLLLD